MFLAIGCAPDSRGNVAAAGGRGVRSVVTVPEAVSALLAAGRDARRVLANATKAGRPGRRSRRRGHSSSPPTRGTLIGQDPEGGAGAGDRAPGDRWDGAAGALVPSTASF